MSHAMTALTIHNIGPGSYNSSGYYAAGNSPHSAPYGEASPYYPIPTPTFYIPTPAFTPLPQGGNYSDSGDYIGGTWYPKQQGLDSDDIGKHKHAFPRQATFSIRIYLPRVCSYFQYRNSRV